MLVQDVALALLLVMQKIMFQLLENQKYEEVVICTGCVLTDIIHLKILLQMILKKKNEFDGFQVIKDH